MATYWLSGTVDRRRAVALLACAVLFPVTALPKGKRQPHPAGFSFELPTGWTVENGEQAAMLVPRGVTVDPGREDNPEVYTVWPSAPGSDGGDAEFIGNLREGFTAQGITLDQDGRPEAFGRSGTIYTFDFTHPLRKAAFRVRVFSMKVKGRTIALIATGLRERLVSRDRALREIAASLDYDR